jgi:hypothetical protein
MQLKQAAIAAILIASVTVASTQQQQRTEEQVATDLLKAAKVSDTTYRSNGMSGLIGKSKDCYKQLAKFKYYCLYLDLAARHIDRLGGGGKTFPLTEYFDDDQFLNRAGEIFIKSNLTMEQANEYLANMTPIVNKFVDDQAKKNR